MAYDLKLTENEKKAKDFFLQFLMKADSVECDESANFKMELPSWFDLQKFQRGQKFYKDNEFAILFSNMLGLLALIADPTGLQVLAATGRSSTPETARKRYAQTLFHLKSWYENELVPDSKSWKSLELVRKMHYRASQMSKEKYNRCIPQKDVSITAYAFMAFPITRPQFLGMDARDTEGREGFVYFWAVISSMLGVKDEFNMCLHSLEVVILNCEMARRYLLLSNAQLETPLFLHMAKAFFDGVQFVIKGISFEVLLFMFKRIIGVPGYQYNVDSDGLSKPLFTEEESKKVQQFYLQDERYAYKKDYMYENKFRLLSIHHCNNSEVQTSNVPLSALHHILGLKYADELEVTIIENSEWKMYLNDSKFHKLTFSDKAAVKFIINFINSNSWWKWGVTKFYVFNITRKLEVYK